MLTMKHDEIAKNLFLEGYNCSQAVFAAFCDVTGIERKTALLLASSFGGGMGKLREVCGAVSGMFLVAGALYGYDDPKDFTQKNQHYARIQELAAAFQKENQFIVCRQLLGLDVKKESPIASERTKAYYQKRPCAELVACAARIMDEYIEENGGVL